MELIIITPEYSIENELELVNKLFENGLEWLHVRKPFFTKYEYIDYLNCINRRYHSKIVIHGYYHLYRESVIGGVHLNEAARNDPATSEQIKNIPPSKVSASFHSWEEILVNKFMYRYVFISPVFDSISKPGYKAAIELAGAVETKAKLTSFDQYCPEIIGLGGVVPEQISVLHKNGFDGAAMLGAIWDNEDPLAVLRKSQNVIRELRNY